MSTRPSNWTRLLFGLYEVRVVTSLILAVEPSFILIHAFARGQRGRDGYGIIAGNSDDQTATVAIWSVFFTLLLLLKFSKKYRAVYAQLIVIVQFLVYAKTRHLNGTIREKAGDAAWVNDNRWTLALFHGFHSSIIFPVLAIGTAVAVYMATAITLRPIDSRNVVPRAGIVQQVLVVVGGVIAALLFHSVPPKIPGYSISMDLKPWDNIEAWKYVDSAASAVAEILLVLILCRSLLANGNQEVAKRPQEKKTGA